MYNQNFSENVNWLLGARDWSKTELHKRASVSLAFVSDITAGKGNPSVDVMEKISGALGVPLPLLLLPNADLRYIVELLEALQKGHGVAGKISDTGRKPPE
ncbi:helix-turn-helix domain-containing protein [Metapseudomonas furukawaii]|uniref:helix-turn-helix domain-containing protein n=1 Tax=Metapseudomonas furukawaii TaxID=1149133 RepID=UPI0009D939BD|nr:helix-turn-helix domain-containing protein [Pseudomonas furukawaii]